MAKPSFEQLRAKCDRLAAQHAKRDAMYAAMRRMMLMEWPDQPRGDYVKPTMSPDPFNTIMGIVRLMTSTDPKFSVNSGPDPESRRQSDALEQAMTGLWHMINRRRRWPLHYEAVLSAALYSEVCMQVASLRETADFLSGRDSEVARYAQTMPYMIDVIDPATVYPQYSPLGLRSVLRRYQRPLWEVFEFWGKLAEKSGLKARGLDDDAIVEFNDYWDPTWRCVWTSQSLTPILFEKHELNHIPWVCMVATGTSLFQAPEQQRFPMLYPVWRGHWWERQNLMMTQIYSVTSAMMHPSWKVTRLTGEPLPMDFDQPGSQVLLRPGEDITPLQKELIDPAVRHALDLSMSKMIESTLPRVVFGEAPGPSTAYASVNLLSQAGRLPLVPIERQVARAIAAAFEILLDMAAQDGQTITLRDGMEVVAISPDMAAAASGGIHVQLKLDIPQDRLSMANVVTLLRNSLGPDKLPLISRQTALELLGFLQATQETDAILSELFTGVELQRMLQQEPPHTALGRQMQPEPARPPNLPEQFNPAAGGLPPVEVFPPVPPVTNTRGPVENMPYE